MTHNSRQPTGARTPARRTPMTRRTRWIWHRYCRCCHTRIAPWNSTDLCFTCRAEIYP